MTVGFTILVVCCAVVFFLGRDYWRASMRDEDAKRAFEEQKARNAGELPPKPHFPDVE